ncbi:MAG: glutaredoxin 3 [Lautropia sp.]
MARPPIVMYSKTTCPYCHEAARLLRDRGVADFDQIQIDLEPARRQEMVERSGGRRTVPQIFIGDTHVGGCDDLFALDARGGLSPLLAGDS